MARKPAQAGEKTSDRHLAGAVRESAEQIWLAGLGAFAKAQEEGTKVFEALVQEGEVLQRRTRSATEERIDEVAGRFTEAATQLTRQASQSWDKLEQLFEHRVARALTRLGVPSPGDIRELTALLEALNDRIEALDTRPARAAPSAKAGATRAGTATRATGSAGAGSATSGTAGASKAVPVAKARRGRTSAKPDQT
jgi:poly(hydroxyalkanoate) granule-associated protein